MPCGRLSKSDMGNGTNSLLPLLFFLFSCKFLRQKEKRKVRERKLFTSLHPSFSLSALTKHPFLPSLLPHICGKRIGEEGLSSTTPFLDNVPVRRAGDANTRRRRGGEGGARWMIVIHRNVCLCADGFFSFFFFISKVMTISHAKSANNVLSPPSPFSLIAFLIGRGRGRGSSRWRLIEKVGVERRR